MKLLTTLIALCSSALMAGEINWTPRFATIAVEGGTLQRAVFSDGERNYGFSLDGETRIDSSSNGARITFTRAPSAVFNIGPATSRVVLPSSSEGLAALRNAAHSYVTAGHDEITYLSETADVLAINGWKSHRFQFTYGLHGRRYNHSITFLTFEKGQQVVLSTLAYPKDFEEAMARSDYFIRTWHEVPKGTPTGS
jgi:hypothetical protein